MSEQETVVIAPAAPRGQRRVDRWFYISVALLMIVFNVVAFAPSIIDPSRRNAPLPLTPLVTAHAIVSAAWLVLFLTQATLVATRYVSAHRRIGMFGVALTVLFILVGSFSVIGQARRGFDLSGDIDRLSQTPGVSRVAGTVGLLFLFLNFAIVVGAGLCYRHRPSVHKRLMLLALLGLADDFERALAYVQNSPQSVAEGLQALQRRLGQILSTYGVIPFESVGQPFDPMRHEAIGTVQSDQHAAGVVFDEVSRGYAMGDDILRPARVRVVQENE